MVECVQGNDLTLYDRGYQFDNYDLVVLTVEDLDQTVHVLTALPVSYTHLTLPTKRIV